MNFFIELAFSPTSAFLAAEENFSFAADSPAFVFSRKSLESKFSDVSWIFYFVFFAPDLIDSRAIFDAISNFSRESFRRDSNVGSLPSSSTFH